MKKIFGIIIDDDNVKNIIYLQKNLYEKIQINFGEFLILNLKNLRLFTKKTPSISLKNLDLPNNFKIFTPQNSHELKKFLIDKKFTAFLIIGKGLGNFYIYRLLKKNKINLILLMNLGGFANAYIEKTFFKNKKTFFFGMYRILKIYLIRILTIINFFPKINIYFESDQKIVKRLSNGISRKLNKIIPFINILYYQKIISVNSSSADELINSTINPTEEIITFVDSNFVTGDRIEREGDIDEKLIAKYFKDLSKFLNLLSVKFKKKVIISLHPKTDIDLYKKHLNNFTLEKYKTVENIKKSFIVIFHDSTAISSAVFLKKKIICLKSTTLGDYMEERINRNLHYLNYLTISLDNMENIQLDTLIQNLDAKTANYDDYINSRLISDKFERGDDKIIRILKDTFL